MYSPEIEALFALVAELLPDNVTGEITPARARQVLGEMLGYVGNLNTNQVKGSVFRVPFVVNVAGLPTVPTVLIPARSRILGMDVRAINGTDATSTAAGVRAEPIDFRLIAYPTGTIDALVDEQATTTTTIKAQWVRTSGSDEQKRAYFDELIPEDHSYLKGEVVYYVFPNGATRLLQWRANSASFIHPVPTGADDDPFYAPFALAQAPASGVSQQYVDEANAEQSEVIDLLEDRMTAAENDADALEASVLQQKSWIGSLASLATTAKTSIVAAINELKASITSSAALIARLIGNNSNSSGTSMTLGGEYNYVQPNTYCAAIVGGNDNVVGPAAGASMMGACQQVRNEYNPNLAVFGFGQTSIPAGIPRGVVAPNLTLYAKGTYFDTEYQTFDQWRYMKFGFGPDNTLMINDQRVGMRFRGTAYSNFALYMPGDILFIGGVFYIQLVQYKSKAAFTPADWQVFGGGGSSSTPGPSSAGIDYATTVAVNNATTLTANAAHLVNGNGFILTLPNATDNAGKQLFVEIDAAAAGMYKIGDYYLHHGETILLTATAGNWRRLGGNWKPLSAELVSMTSAVISNNVTTDIPFQGLNNDNSGGLLLSGAANTLKAARAGLGQVFANLFTYAQQGDVLEVKLYVGGNVYKSYVTVVGGTGTCLISKPVTVAAGDQISVAVYGYSTVTSGQIGNTIPGGSFLSFSENVQ